jgi:hypothetical protein
MPADLYTKDDSWYSFLIVAGRSRSIEKSNDPEDHSKYQSLNYSKQDRYKS